MKQIIVLLILILANSQTIFSQPKERLKNRYREPNMSYGAPYTMFDIAGYTNNKTTGIANKVGELRALISVTGYYKNIYNEIYTNYWNTPNPSPGNQEDKEYDPLAAHAKNKAFIALVGVDGSGSLLPQATINRLQDEAYYALQNMNTDVVNFIRFRYAGVESGQLLLYRTRELVQYLQAYDMLKASGRIANFADDKNEDGTNPRNRLREFTRNIYDVGMGVWGPARWGDNHTLGFAAAIGLASVVLNDAGAANMRWKYCPDTWAEKAHKFLNKAMWEGYWHGAPRLAVEGQISGYAEGPTYYEYFMLGTGMPYLRAMHNLIPGSTNRDYLYTQKWKDLFTWRNELTTASGFYFGFDNSFYGTENSLLLTGMPEFTYLPPNTGPSVGGFLPADLLALHPTINDVDNRNGVVSMPQAGQTVMRMKNGSDNHYFIFQHEQGTPVCESGHEDDDLGSFQLGVNDYLLVFDPPYLGWNDVSRTNNYSHHNTVLLLEESEDKVNSDNILKYASKIEASEGLRTQNGNLYNKIESSFSNTNSGNVSRFIRMMNDFDNVYYVIDDIINANENVEKVSIQINGNGSSSDNSSTYTRNGGVSYWTHPCTNLNGLNGWNLASISAAINGNNNPLIIENNDLNSSHNTGYGLLTKNRDVINGYNNGYNSRVRITHNQKNTEIKTLLLPYRCNSNPFITKTETSNSASITVHFPGGSTIHVSKANPTDTAEIVNPFDSTTSKLLRTNATRVVLSMANDSVFKTKNYCESYTYFRKAAIEKGTFLSYDSINYISSLTTGKFSAYYELTGKYKYQGNTHIYDSTGFVIAQFYLPEVDSGFAMIARGENVDSSAYNMTTKTLTVKFSEGKSDLSIELANPCQLSCFFPPDTTNIDSIFNFSTGTTEILSHDLQVTANTGVLNITNYSEMSLCSNTILYNKDSIILSSPAIGKRKQPLVCSNLGGLNDVREPRSRITVNDGATLILLPNSVTHINQGSSIYVAPKGTLIVKSGAQVIIGGSTKLGFGELFLDRGANLCVEPGANISFYKNVGDTQDENLFWVYHPQNSTGLGSTVVGVDKGSTNYYRLIDSTFITSNNTCTQLCDFISIFPNDGITDRAWGYFSSGKPLAKFRLNTNYICPNDSVIIDTKDNLNEVNWEYEVCELNTSDSTVISNSCFIQGNIAGVGDNCIEYNYLPTRINLSANYNFIENHLYKIKLKTINGCGVLHDTSQIIYILNNPRLYFNFASEICEGNGFAADSFYTNVSYGNNKHIWSVDLLSELIEEDTMLLHEEDNNYNTAVWQYDTLINEQFNFPGYRFKGNNNYLLTLEIENTCGIIEFSDTVSVPFGVNITADRLVSYSTPIGMSGIQLNGAVSQAYDSIKWYPTNKLINYTGLNPTTTTMDSTVYVLQAYKNNCIAADSILIKHKQLVNLGGDTTICSSNNLVIGNALDGVVMLGLLTYLDEGTYSTIYNDIYANVTDAAKRLSLFLYQDNYQYYGQLNTTDSLFTTLMKIMNRKIKSTSDFSGALTTYKNQSLSDAITYFKEVFWPGNPSLTNEIDSFVNSNGGISSFLGAIGATLPPYFDQFTNNYESINVTTSWYKNDTLISGEDNWLNIYEQNITKPMKYSLVINNGNIIEYDEYRVMIDSALSPFFIPAYAIDSTIYFNGYPNTPTHLKYFWNFGDGETSTSKTTIHTFHEFNKSYYVCLTVTNMCNSYTYCDTLKVDTAFNSQFWFGKNRGNKLNNQTTNYESAKNSLNEAIVGNYLGDNIPNPFSEYTEINYEIADPTDKSIQLLVTNALGKDILTIPIHERKGKIILNKADLSSGIYYYYLNTNGIKTKGKLMLIK